MVGVVPPPVVEVLEQPTAVSAATERTTASRAPQRRRRGIVSKSIQASVAPEPAAYQGARPDRGWFESGLSWAVVVGVDAVKTKEVVTPVVELTVTGDTVKAVVAPARLLLVAVKFTAPVNPLAGVMVKVQVKAETWVRLKIE